MFSFYLQAILKRLCIVRLAIWKINEIKWLFQMTYCWRKLHPSYPIHFWETLRPMLVFWAKQPRDVISERSQRIWSAKNNIGCQSANFTVFFLWDTIHVLPIFKCHTRFFLHPRKAMINFQSAIHSCIPVSGTGQHAFFHNSPSTISTLANTDT